MLGDLAQGTTGWAAQSWADLLTHLGKPSADLRVLDTGYRVPRQILDYASRLLPQIAPGLSAASSVRQDPAALAIRALDGGPAVEQALVDACAETLARPGSCAVIAADDQIGALSGLLARAGVPHAVLDGAAAAGGSQITLVPVTLAKGLEFDQVIVVEPAQIAAAEARGLHRLYVALTRAVSRLIVLHAQPLPGALAAGQRAPAATSP